MPARALSSLLLTGVLSVAIASPARPAAGDLDPSFGEAGTTTTDFGAESSVNAIAVFPDGGLVVAGYAGKDPAEGETEPAPGDTRRAPVRSGRIPRPTSATVPIIRNPAKPAKIPAEASSTADQTARTVHELGCITRFPIVVHVVGRWVSLCQKVLAILIRESPHDEGPNLRVLRWRKLLVYLLGHVPSTIPM